MGLVVEEEDETHDKPQEDLGRTPTTIWRLI